MKNKAVCIRCGTFKKDAFARCPQCGLTPKTDFEAARALILSEKTLYGDTEIGRSAEELEAISQSIQSGRPYPIDGEEQKTVVREYWSYLKSQPEPKPALRKLLKWGALLCILLSVIVVVIWWLLAN
ncbi:hypothetical protein [Kaarinaea lacus]